MAQATPPITLWSDEELREQVGQLFIVGFHGSVPDDDITSLIATHKVGAVILFQRNVESAKQLSELTQALQNINTQAGNTRPLFIAIDQENGLVTRIKHPITPQLPGSMALGATGDPSNAFRAAVATGQVLKCFGINMNYGPVADINSEPKNPVIGVRSFSDDPEMVGRFVSAQLKGFQESGVVSCIKHFPGHGDTAIDSHYGLPSIPKIRQALDECELIPFRRAVAEGVDSIMTAHIAMPGVVDASVQQFPASLNPEIISILRDEMKYDGLIISDCLEMDGVRKTFGTEESAVLALKAGTDSVMICHTISSQTGAIERVIKAVRQGELSQTAIQNSVKRVEKLKSRYITSATDSKLSGLLEQSNVRNEELSSELYSKSATIVRKEPRSFPSTSDQETKIAFLTPGNASILSGVVESGEKTREEFTPAAYVELVRSYSSRVTAIEYFESKSLTTEEEAIVSEADTVIFCSRNANLNLYQKSLGLSLGKRLEGKLIVIATCDPYDFLEEVNEIRNYVAIYEPTIPAFKSAVNMIFNGAMKISQGRLPVGLPDKGKYLDDIKLLGNTEEELTAIWKLWENIFPEWHIEYSRLENILKEPNGHHFIHQHGFCLSYLFDTCDGNISCVGVLKEHRGKGLGTALIRKAHSEMRRSATETGKREIKCLTIGSSFPRFWAGTPLSIDSKYREFFLHRGFQKSKSPTSRDLFKSIKDEVVPPDIMRAIENVPATFAPWTPDGYEECMEKQRLNFGHNYAWVQAYELLAGLSQHHEVMVAHSTITGAQIGWTVMCSPSSFIAMDFAFSPLMPSGDKTGLIACVGIDKDHRGGGLGLALLVRAMENMRERGMEGVYIDWVVIRGFYEKLGFVPFWEFEAYSW